MLTSLEMLAARVERPSDRAALGIAMEETFDAACRHTEAAPDRERLTAARRAATEALRAAPGR